MLQRPCITPRFWALSALLLAHTSILMAQSERATISGTVLDATGAVVPGARVVATSIATNVTSATTTTDAGVYTVASLPVGQYSVRVEKEGFRPAVRSGITLNAAANIRVDVTLEVGTAQQTVEVSADVQQLQTETAKTTVTLSNKLVDELPLVVAGRLRSPFDLAALTPEVKNPGDTTFSIGGGQASSYGVTLDGVSQATTRALQTSWIAVNAPSVEAITEFTVDSNGFKAEHGHAAGGVMTFVSKSGANDFHGSLYEFLRNEKLDARRFFEAKRGIYKQHDFGASAGGPIYIPKIINGQNKSFFFASYEGFRDRVGAATTSASVPTEEMYNGDFSRWVDRNNRLIPVYDPSTLRTDPATGRRTREQFLNNQVPRARFDPLAVKLIGVYQQSLALKPNTGAAPGTSEYVRSNFLITQGTVVNPWDKFSVKGDHIFSERNRLSGYYGRNRVYEKPGPNGPRTLPGFYTGYNDLTRLSDVYRMSWDHNFSPTLLMHFYAGGNDWREGHFSPNELIGNWKDKFCYPNVPDCNDNLASVGFSDFTAWGGPSNNGSENTIYSFHNDLTWIRGKHTFKFGGMFQRSHYNGFGEQWDSGRIDFSFTGTGVPGDTNFTTAGGNSFASFLLGHANSGAIDTVRFISQQWPYFAGYFQDDIRLSQKLTVHLGLRWETTLPPVESKDRWSDFSPTRSNPAADNIPGALIYAGAGQGREGSRSLSDSYWRAFGPHIGMAYTLSDKTVIRTAYSRSFGAVTTVTGSTHQRGFTQTLSFPNTTQGVEPTFRFQDGMPSWPNPPFIDPSFANGDNIPWWQNNEAARPPLNDTWTLSIQHQITPTLLLEAAYNGLAGSRLQSALLQYNQLPVSVFERYGRDLLLSNINSPAAAAAGIRAPYRDFARFWGTRATVAQALRPYPQYSGIDTYAGGGDHSGHSTYHALVLRLEKRYSAGLNFQTSYVFSKSLTDSDSYWAGDFVQSRDHYNRGLEKSISALDITHNFKLGLVYELPFGRGKKYLTSGLAGVIFGGWRVATIQFYSSGAPVNLGTTISLPIFARSNLPTVTTHEGWRGATARGDFDPQTDRFFQPASFFGAQPNDRVGNMTRYNPKLRLFPNYNENITVAKTFYTTERTRLDFRWEAFNLLNRVRFGTGPRTLQDNNFGRLTSNSDVINDPRRMQLALKFYW